MYIIYICIYDMTNKFGVSHRITNLKCFFFIHQDPPIYSCVTNLGKPRNPLGLQEGDGPCRLVEPMKTIVIPQYSP